MIEDDLSSALNGIYKKCGYDNIIAKVQESNMPNLCDFQSNDCFSLAKIYHQSPFEIAEKIASEAMKDFSLKSLIQEVYPAKPGYINIIVSEKILNKYIIKMASEEKFGLAKPAKPELYFLDYGGPNIAKPLHVGHLRSPIIGESIKRIIQYAGHKTISDIHYGDFGLQIGIIIYGLKERNIKKQDLTLDLMKEIYLDVNKRVKEDESLNKICADITKELQDGNEELVEYWKIIKQISGDDINRIYKFMDIEFNLYDGESDAYEYIDELTNLLNEKNLLNESNGAKIIEIGKETDKKELPPLIYQKSNGAYLYGTTDMATVLKRVKFYNPDHIIYLADLRQDLHFTQFFRAVSKAGIIDENKLEFLGFGTVNDPSGKPFKTREGSSPQLDNLFEKVKTLLKQNKETLNLADEQDLNIIVNSVIKFADLQNNREKDYIFDIEKFSRTEGRTGPYILYTYVRINTLLQKFEKISADFNIDYESKDKIEKDIKLKLLAFEKRFIRSLDERKPNYLADYLYDLCTLLNTFYEINRFGDEENKKYLAYWVYILRLSLDVVKNVLDLLIIKVPKKM